MKRAFLIMIMTGSLLAQGKKEAFPVRTAPLKKKDVSEYVHVYGKVLAENTGYVISPMPGKLIRYTKEQGSFFKKDEPVAYVDRNIPGMKTKPLLVKAPFDGIMAITYAHEGDMVAQTKPIALFYSRDFYIEASVTSNTLSMLKKGAPCLIGPDGKKGNGIVESVSYGVDPQMGMGKVKVRLIKKGHLVPGQVVSVSIATRTEKNVFVVPLESVVKRENGEYVFVYEDGKARMVPVKVLIESKDEAGITSSELKEGMEIITLGAAGLYDGARVTKENR